MIKNLIKKIISEIIFQKRSTERESNFLYLKALLLFSLIILYMCDIFYSMQRQIREWIGIDTITFICKGTSIFLCSFIVLTKLFFVFFLFSVILYLIADATPCSNKCTNFLKKLSQGTALRSAYTAGNILLCAFFLLKFDKSIISEYLTIHSDLTICLICILGFFDIIAIIVPTIIKQFFFLPRTDETS